MATQNKCYTYSLANMNNLLDRLRMEKNGLQHEVQLAGKNKSDITRRVQETRYRLEEVRQEWRQRQGLLESVKCRVHGEEKRADHLQIFCDEVRERVKSNTQRSDQETGTRLQKVDKFEVDMSQLGESLRKNATISGPEGFGCREAELKQEIELIENELLKVEEKLEMIGEGEDEAVNAGQGWVEMETKLRNVKKSTVHWLIQTWQLLANTFPLKKDTIL